jgi:carbonic anhydrase
LIGGIPVTQVIVRSSANVTAGGKSKLSTILHGLTLLISAILIPGLINYIPLASLAAILLLVGYKLSKVALYKGMFKLGWEQFVPFIVTIIAILSTDLLRGIGAGMAIAIFFILRKNYKHAYHYVKESKNDREVITLKLSEEVTFLNKASIQLSLSELPDNSKVVIDGSNSVAVDYDVLEIIEDFKRHAAPGKNIEIETVGLAAVEVMGH